MDFLTLGHVALSLAGILAGLVVLFGLIGAKRLDGWTTVFLTTTIATSVTGFFFPVRHFMPSHAIGILSLMALGIAVVARYPRHMDGGWRRTYVISATVALYFNVFVLVVQLFRKVPALKELAPTQSEPPFLVAQLIVMAIFVVLTILAARNFHSDVRGDVARIAA